MVTEGRLWVQLFAGALCVCNVLSVLLCVCVVVVVVVVAVVAVVVVLRLLQCTHKHNPE